MALLNCCVESSFLRNVATGAGYISRLYTINFLFSFFFSCSLSTARSFNIKSRNVSFFHSKREFDKERNKFQGTKFPRRICLKSKGEEGGHVRANATFLEQKTKSFTSDPQFSKGAARRVFWVLTRQILSAFPRNAN